MAKTTTILVGDFDDHVHTFEMIARSELNYILDRNSHTAALMAIDVADQLPEARHAHFNPQLPHTRASFKIQVCNLTQIFVRYKIRTLFCRI